MPGDSSYSEVALIRGLRDSCDPGLLSRVVAVRSAMLDAWSEPRMPWFTKHGVSHSESVIRLIGEAVKHLQETDERLGCAELFVLVAACYVHDIGMQAFEVDRSMDELTPADHLTIRDEHPTRGRDVIVARTLHKERDQIDLGLVDDDYLAPIALVSQAHGTSTFHQATHALVTAGYKPFGDKFRGDLLGALLLMGDELDINSSRANFPVEQQLPKESVVHHMMNHFVTGVSVMDGATPKRRRIRVNFLFPDTTDTYPGDVQELIGQKLMRQSRFTNDVVESRTNGEMFWDDEIDLYAATDHLGERRRPSGSEAAQLRKLTYEKRLIGRAALLDTLEELLSTSAKVVSRSLELVCTEGADAEVAGVVEWLLACARSNGSEIAHVAPGVVPAGHGIGGVADQIRNQLGLGEFALSDLPRVAAAHERQILLLVEDADSSPELDSVIGDVSRRAPDSLAVVSTRASPSGGFPFYELGSVGFDEIKQHLADQGGWSETRTSERATEIFWGTSGRAGQVLLLLEAERLASLKRVEKAPQ